MTQYLFDPFPESSIHPTDEEYMSFLESTTVDELNGPKGKYVLYLSLMGGADLKKKSRALLRRKNAPAELLEIQKKFAREKDNWTVSNELLDAFEEGDKEDMAFALHRGSSLSMSLLYKFLRRIPPHHMDKLIAKAISSKMNYTLDDKSFSGQSMKLENTWPNALILDSISNLPSDILVLEFGVTDPCSLHDIKLPPNLLFLEIRGPIHGLDALNELDALTTLRIADDVDLSGFRSKSLRYLNSQDASIPEWEHVPNLKGITIREAKGDSLGNLGVLTELESLDVGWHDLSSVELPDLSNCQKLGSLSVSGMDLGVLPGWVGELKSLKNLTLFSGIHTLPSELANLELKRLDLSHLTLTHVLELQGTPPEYVSLRKVTIPDDAPTSAYHFLRMPSTEQAAHEFKFFLEQYPETKAFKALEDYLGGDKTAPVTEAIVAVSRVYVDDEHGPSVNKDLCELLGKCGGEQEQAANKVVSRGFFKSARSVKNAEAKLASINGVDGGVFREFCEEMMAYDEARNLR